MNNKLTKKQFAELAKKTPVKIDNNLYYVVVKVNSQNIMMNEKLKNQLASENKYNNSYIGFLTNEPNVPHLMNRLPIYGESDKYETKHFKSNMDEAISVDLKERGLGLLKRHHELQLKLKGGLNS